MMEKMLMTKRNQRFLRFMKIRIRLMLCGGRNITVTWMAFFDSMEPSTWKRNEFT